MDIRASVIITVYNGAELLEKAVTSVMAQTERNIEILVVDDTSKDGSAALILELAKRDARIRPLLLTTNHGFCKAFNYAVSQARGRWIALLDFDDWYAPERIKTLLDAAEAEGVQMVTDNQIFYDAKAGKEVGTALPKQGKNSIITLDTFLQNTDPTALFDYGQLKPVYQAEFIRAYNVRYPEDAHHGYDYFTLLDFFAVGGKALLVDQALYYYLQPFGSVSRQWMQDHRKRYPFEYFKELNDAAVRKYQNSLTAEQLRLLVRRGDNITALVYMHQIRERLADWAVLDVFKKILTAPPLFWKLVIKRIWRRLFGTRLQRQFYSLYPYPPTYLLHYMEY
jgi:succinoglycan biosynthesis protein ExoO